MTTTLTETDLRFVVSRIPKDIREVMIKNQLFLGGGFIRETISGGKVNDIDLFSESKEALETIAKYLSIAREGSRVHTTDNAITLLSYPRLPVQFITRWLFTSADDLVNSFDFTVCQAGIYYDRSTGKWASVVHDSFYADLAAKRLTYTFPEREEEAGGSMLRVLKFIARGYNIQPNSLAGVIARVALKVDYALLGKGGIDNNEKGVAQVISGLLREVDPMNVIDGFTVIDEHEIIEGA